jgi:hypothetical protein
MSRLFIKKKIYKFYFLLLTLIIIIYLILDLLISNYFFKDYDSGCYEIEDYYYELKKNCSKKDQFKSSFPIVNVYTDEFGMRTGKKNLKKENRDNIFIFGDSFTFGVGLEYEETFIGILEKNLNYNFYNHAVGSYSPTVHYYRLKKTLNNTSIVPNKIIIFLDITDVYDEGNRWIYNENNLKPSLKFNEWKKILEKKNSFIKKNFKINSFLFSKLNFNIRKYRSNFKNAISSKNKIKTSFQGQFTYTNIKELNNVFWSEKIFNYGILKIKENINLISDIARSKDIDFFLVIYPWAETIEFGQKEFNWEKFGEILCENNKCKLINTFPYFRDYANFNKSWPKDLYFINDEHFNIGGNILIAKILKEILIRKN